MRRFLCVLFVLVGLLVGGCRGEVTSGLLVERDGWDTLRVVATFARGDGIGAPQVLAADSLEVRVYDARYDTLYAGPGPLVPVPDRRLGDREALLVEACLPLGGTRVCEQEAVAASPKRIRADFDVTFPHGSDHRRGRYALELAVERERYDGAGWDRVDAPVPVSAYLLASVEGVAEAGEGVVRVPVQAGTGRFDLGRHPGHADFAYHLKSRLHEASEAVVRFELYGALGREPVRLAVDEARVREMTREDRAAEVAHFVEQAAEGIIDRLEVFDRARVYIDAWAYDDVLHAYTADIEIVGRGDDFFDRFDRDRLRGKLRVPEDGAGGVFQLEEASRRVEAAWREHVSSDVLRLGTLEPRWAQDEAVDETVAPS